VDTISEKDTQSADDKKKEKISYIEAIPEWHFQKMFIFKIYIDNL